MTGHAKAIKVSLYTLLEATYRVFHVFSLGRCELELVELDTVNSWSHFSLYTAAQVKP